MASGHTLRKSHDLPVNVERRRLHRGDRAAAAARPRAPGAPSASRCSAGSASAASIAAASAAGSPGGTRQPVTPCSTVSTGPPRSEAITGRPIACASITTRPNASGSRGGMHDDVRQHQRRRHVVALAGETQPIGDAQRLGLTDQARRVALAPLVRSHQHAAHVAPRHPGQRLDQHRLPLPTRQPAGQQHDQRAIRQPPRLRQPLHPIARYDCRIEPRGIDAARDDPDPGGIGPVARHDQLGDEAACGDHPLALAPSPSCSGA